MPLSSNKLRGESIVESFMHLKNCFELKNVTDRFLFNWKIKLEGQNKEKENESDVKNEKGIDFNFFTKDLNIKSKERKIGLYRSWQPEKSAIKEYESKCPGLAVK